MVMRAASSVPARACALTISPSAQSRIRTSSTAWPASTAAAIRQSGAGVRTQANTDPAGGAAGAAPASGGATRSRVSGWLSSASRARADCSLPSVVRKRVRRCMRTRASSWSNSASLSSLPSGLSVAWTTLSRAADSAALDRPSIGPRYSSSSASRVWSLRTRASASPATAGSGSPSAARAAGGPSGPPSSPARPAASASARAPRRRPREAPGGLPAAVPAESKRAMADIPRVQCGNNTTARPDWVVDRRLKAV